MKLRKIEIITTILYRLIKITKLKLQKIYISEESKKNITSDILEIMREMYNKDICIVQ